MSSVPMGGGGMHAAHMGSMHASMPMHSSSSFAGSHAMSSHAVARSMPSQASFNGGTFHGAPAHITSATNGAVGRTVTQASQSGSIGNHLANGHFANGAGQLGDHPGQQGLGQQGSGPGGGPNGGTVASHHPGSGGPGQGNSGQGNPGHGQPGQGQPGQGQPGQGHGGQGNWNGGNWAHNGNGNGGNGNGNWNHGNNHHGGYVGFSPFGFGWPGLFGYRYGGYGGYGGYGYGWPYRRGLFLGLGSFYGYGGYGGFGYGAPYASNSVYTPTYYCNYGLATGTTVVDDSTLANVAPTDAANADASQTPGEAMDQASNQQGDQGAAETIDAATADKLITDAGMQFRQQDFAAAIRSAGRATMTEQPDPRAHQILWLALQANKDYKGAAIEAHALAQLGATPSWSVVASSYDDPAQFEPHLRALEQYVGRNKDADYAAFLLGYDYLVLGHRKAAEGWLGKAAKLDGSDFVAQGLLQSLTEDPSGVAKPGPGLMPDSQ